jgi:DNA primase
VLAFDSDEAGARAAERAFAFQEQFPVQAAVMIMPEGLDPAEFVAKHGADAVREAAKAARPLVEYMVRRTVGRHDLSSVEGQSAAVADVVPMLAKLQDPVRRIEYGHLLADLAGVSEASVMQALERGLGGRPQEVAKTIKRTSAQDKVEREMLKLIARRSDLYAELAPRLTDDHFRGAANRRAFDALRGAGGDVSALAGGADEAVASLISSLAVEPLNGDPTPEYAENVWTRLQEFLLKSRSDAMRMHLQKINPVDDPEGYETLFRELVQIDGELRRIRADPSS